MLYKKEKFFVKIVKGKGKTVTNDLKGIVANLIIEPQTKKDITYDLVVLDSDEDEMFSLKKQYGKFNGMGSIPVGISVPAPLILKFFNVRNRLSNLFSFTKKSNKI